MKKDYQIAGHRIRIEGSEDWVNTVEALDGFKPFEVESEGEPLAYFISSDEEVPQLTDSQYENEVDGIVDVFGRYQDGYLFVMSPPEGERLCLWKKDGVYVLHFKGQLMPRLVRFALWIAYGLATLPLRTIAIHTSVIQY